MPEVDWLIAIIGIEAIFIAFLVTSRLEYKNEAEYWKDTYFKSRRDKK
jgi:uncharacterized membrane protein YobD (UPF0266 family)